MAAARTPNTEPILPEQQGPMNLAEGEAPLWCTEPQREGGSEQALISPSPLPRISDFQDVARPADGVWRRQTFDRSTMTRVFPHYTAHLDEKMKRTEMTRGTETRTTPFE
ncbi:unnamed protein product [Pleuronectes platessa]|uniref:Uncharacterized protein n=1 Tax=Pleuronectes platessa TaxID=8262 RepID=A0A9N7TP28_PLEPL|nr:unnamed protein product [Pleuronectes platessa]